MEYVKLNDRDHVKSNLSFYVGECTFVEKGLLMKKKLSVGTYHKGVCKLYDEIITNAFDHVRSNKTKITDPIISIYYSKENQSITITNSSVMPVIGQVTGTKDNIIPRVVLTNMKTSSNYVEKKDVAGRHGYGLKLVWMLSKHFSLSVSDKTHSYMYTKTDGVSDEQIQETPVKNLDIVGPFFSVTFVPDNTVFGLTDDEINNNNIEFFIKGRIMEFFLYFSFLNQSVEILFNGLEFSTPHTHDPWKLVLTEQTQHVVNRFTFTYQDHKKKAHGGKCLFVLQQKTKRIKSMNYCILNGLNVDDGLMSNNVFKLIKQTILKNEIDVKNYFNTFCIANCPGIAFTGQDKLKIDGKIIFDFDPKIVFPMIIFKDIMKDISRDNINRKANVQKNALDLVNYRKPYDKKNLVLCLVEGLAAKTSLSRAFDKYKNRKKIGIYAMTGKIFNCIRDPSKSKLNKIVLSIAKILGLGFDNKQLESRFSEIIIVPDPDVDGAHIACLALALFREIFPSFIDKIHILELPRFTCCGKMFFTTSKYESHLVTDKKNKHDTIYAKGLGSLKESDFVSIVNNMGLYKKRFVITNTDIELLDGLFGRNSQARKLMFKTQEGDFWTSLSDVSKKLVTMYDSTPEMINTIIPTVFDEVEYNEISLSCFLMERYKEFLAYSNRRAIPQLIDGDTMVTRKIKWTLLHMGQKSLRADAFCGHLVCQTLYHHGDQSLYKSAAKLGSRWSCGLNQIFVDIDGEAGSRSKFGKDISPSRYIKFSPNKVAMQLYKKIDFKVCAPAVDENQEIEPPYLLPILPVLLINGSEGIGTGFNTYIPPHDITEVFHWYYNKLKGIETDVPLPSVRGFEGTIRLLKKTAKVIFPECDTKQDFLLADDSSSDESFVDVCRETYSDTDTESLIFETDQDEDEPSKEKEIVQRKERLLIKGVINKSVISEIPFNINIENFTKWLVVNEIEFDNSESTSDSCVYVINNDVDKVKKKLVSVKTINANFFDENWLHTDCELKTIFEMFYTKRLWFYKQRVGVLITDLVKEYARVWNLKYLIEKSYVELPKTEDEQEELVSDCWLSWTEHETENFVSENNWSRKQIMTGLHSLKVVDCTEKKVSKLIEQLTKIMIEYKRLTTQENIHVDLWIEDLVSFSKYIKVTLL
ncbi:DNA topoisomerase 2 [Salmon gill poxvirus]